MDKSKAWFIIAALVSAILGLYTVAFLVFQWRNPKANSMTFYREPISIITFQKMDRYQ